MCRSAQTSSVAASCRSSGSTRSSSVTSSYLTSGSVSRTSASGSVATSCAFASLTLVHLCTHSLTRSHSYPPTWSLVASLRDLEMRKSQIEHELERVQLELQERQRKGPAATTTAAARPFALLPASARATGGGAKHSAAPASGASTSRASVAATEARTSNALRSQRRDSSGSGVNAR